MTEVMTPPAAPAVEAAAAAHLADASTRSPDQWAEILFPASASGRMHDDAWKHAAADQLHGWRAYEARSGKQPVMSRAIYEAALAAVSSNPLSAYAAADHRKKG